MTIPADDRPFTQAAILTVTLDPALDLSTEAAQVVPGPKLRVSEPIVEPGGGGINVARAIGLMGGQALAVAALGGLTGSRLTELMRAGGHALVAVPIAGETRQGLTVTDRRDGRQFRFVLPGPAWDAPQEAQMLAAVEAQISERALVVLSGSQPPGVSVDFPVKLARVVSERQGKLIVDTSGAAMAALIAAPKADAPFMLRLDETEVRAQRGGQTPTLAEAADLAAGLVARGVARVVILARGAEGSVLASDGLRLACMPPAVPVKSKVGAGDSFTAGFTLALARGEGLDAALRLGTAAAAAAVMTGSTELCHREDVEALLPRCRISPA